MKSTTAAAATVLVALTTLAGTVPVAQASGGDDDRVIRTGSCSDGARWKIKAKEDDGRIEVEAEIDSNTPGQSWVWVLKHNGAVSSRGTSRTTGRSGSFEVERKLVDNRGRDTFTFRARHAGQTCVAKVGY